MSTPVSYPTGIVTIVFTDMEDSTNITHLLEESGRWLYERYLRDPCRQRLLAQVRQHRGFEIQRQGDGHMFVFQSADDALAAVVAFQQSLATEPITYQQPSEARLFSVSVRIGVHTTRTAREPQPMENGLVEYPGTDTNFAARIMALGKGGQILLSEETRARAADLGAHELHEWPDRRLKSFEEQPQTVYEILYQPDQVPSEPGTRFFPAFYTGEPNRYIPRPQKEEQVFAQFRNKRQDGTTSRLVTIHAEGGMGKTRLAVTCAVQMAGLFEGGIYLVRLGETSSASAAGVAEAIGRELGLLPEASGPEALLQELKRRRTRTLLLLDNYEAVSCEEAAGFLVRLATETPGIYLLVASRVLVNVPHLEQVVSLEEGMDDDEARALFLARARLKGKLADDPTADEAAHLARILRLTEQIPLAVELAAAWVGYETLQEIADGLASTPLGKQTSLREGAVPADHAAAGDRHRSLTRSLNWSYALLGKNLGPAAQQVFAACGLFADTFDATAVTAISGEGATGSILIRLQDSSLVRATEVDGATRYGLHRFTREYARQRLADFDDADAVRRQFIAHYVTLVQEHCSRLNSRESRDRLDQEWRNAVAATDVARAMQEHEAVLLLAGLQEYVDRRGLWSVWADLASSAVAAARMVGRPSARGAALNNLGVVSQLQGRWPEALEAHQEALGVFRELGDRQGEGQALNNLGIVYKSLGRSPEAMQAYESAVAISRELDQRRDEGQALGNQGNLYRDQGRWPEAISAYQQALTIFREIHDRPGLASTLYNLAILYQLQRAWPEALQAYQQALAIFRKSEDRQGEGQALDSLGVLYQLAGRGPEAVQAHQEALAVFRALEHRHDEAGTLQNLGVAYQAQGRGPEAMQAHQEASAIYRELGDRQGEGRALNSLGIVYQSAGRSAEAMTTHQEALAIFRELGDRHGKGQALGNLGNLHREQGRWPDAISAYQQALTIFREIGDREGEEQTLGNLRFVYQELGDRRGEGITLTDLGVACESLGRWQEAIDAYERAVTLFREVRDPRAAGHALHNLGSVSQRLQRGQEAVSAYQQAVTLFRETGDRASLAVTLTNLGVVQQSLRLGQEAINAQQEAVAIFQELGDRWGAASSLNNLGILYQEQCQWQEALAAHEKALAIFRALGDRRGVGQTLGSIALLWEARGQWSNALGFAQGAVAVLEQTETQADLDWARAILARIEGAAAKGGGGSGRGFWGGLSDLLKRPGQHRDD